MKFTVIDRTQISFLLPDFESQINLYHPFSRLARAMDWSVFEKESGAFYCTGLGVFQDRVINDRSFSFV